MPLSKRIHLVKCIHSDGSLHEFQSTDHIVQGHDVLKCKDCIKGIAIKLSRKESKIKQQVS